MAIDLLNQEVYRPSDDWPVLPETFSLPNVKRMLLPDEGYLFWDVDLQQADAQIVAWEADDDELKEVFRDPSLDLHTENAKTIFGSCPYKGHVNRKRAKAGVHAVNYHVYPRTLARALGITVHEAENFIKTWFGAHPKIKEWHKRTNNQMLKRGYIENRFGFRKYFYGRTDHATALSEALAWTPQSSVGIIVNKVWQVMDRMPTEELEVKLQVHDSLVQQVRKDLTFEYMPKVKAAFDSVVVPYDDPLVIGSDLEIGSNAGNCVPVTWDGYLKDLRTDEPTDVKYVVV